MPAKLTVKAQPYPYKIPPIIPPDPAREKKLDRWNILEFLRIEALLRSSEVMDLFMDSEDFWEQYDEVNEIYKKDPTLVSASHLGKLSLEDRLVTEYKVGNGWMVLVGAHHNLLNFKNPPNRNALHHPTKKMDHGSSFILDLAPLYEKEKGFSGVLDLDRSSDLESSLLNKEPRFLWLRVDASYAPTKTLGELKKQLQKRHQELQEIPYYNRWISWNYGLGCNFYISLSFPYHPNKQPPIQDLRAWINYFRWYDLHKNEGKSFAQTAITVFGDSQKAVRIKQAYQRVGKLIHYAATKNWPPPAKFLNKRLPSLPPQ